MFKEGTSLFFFFLICFLILFIFAKKKKKGFLELCENTVLYHLFIIIIVYNQSFLIMKSDNLFYLSGFSLYYFLQKGATEFIRKHSNDLLNNFKKKIHFS